MEINNPLFNRLKEYRVDFAYTSGSFFVATDWLKKWLIKKGKTNYIPKTSATGFGIESLMVLQLILTKVAGKKLAIFKDSIISFSSVYTCLSRFY